MASSYSQLRAMLSITKASLISTFRSPSSVIFSIGFPLIFILAFGFMSGGAGFSLDVALNKNADTSNPVYHSLMAIPGLHFVDRPDSLITEDLEKGNITAVVNIGKDAQDSGKYLIHIKSSNAVKLQDLNLLQSVLKSVVTGLDERFYPNNESVAIIDPKIEKIPGRLYREIDFVLPGQLGFSLLAAGVFGVAFLFFNLRQQLVLKRFFATPVTRTHIIIGEMLSRVVFQMVAVVVLLIVGVLGFQFTMINGFITFVDLMLLSFLGLIVFMGYGFIVSNVSKNESTIPPLSNLFTFPQMLLSGVFFPISVFPKWIQTISNLLPLTHLNNAMREVSFNGASLVDEWREIGILFIWGIIVYAIAIKVFKWE